MQFKKMKFLILLATVFVLGNQANAGVPKKFLNFGNHVNGQLESGGKIWVVLVAGSNGFDNYRHQADVCHAYQVSHANGIPDEQIVVFMYDDIANDPENPLPGKIINQPNGKDVYHGVPKDYIGEEVLPTNLISVLKGDKAAVKGKGSGKVVESGPDDHVFIYFADHGGEGLICFPNFENNLYSDVLNDALKDLHKSNKFAKLVFYLESCESGSMFENILPNNISIYATTAAGPAESSYGTYCDDTVIPTCLGDEYSVAWMEDSDNHTISKELLHVQFEDVKKKVASSTPHEYGDLTIGKQFYAGDFQGNNGTFKNSEDQNNSPQQGRSVNSRDIPLETLKRKIQLAHQSNQDITALQIKLRIMEQKRQLARDTTKTIVLSLVKTDAKAERFLAMRTRATNNMQCYKNSVEYYIRRCFSNSPYTLGQMYVLANLCNNGFDHEQIKEAMDNSCMDTISNVN